jgi:hypothetical protein
MLFTTRSYGLGKEVKKRILLGNFVLSSGYYDEYYRKAQKVRTLIRNELKDILNNCDAIAMPTTPDIAFMHGESREDPLKIYLADVTTAIPNLAGVPAISIPSSIINGMPTGLQLIGRPLDEQLLFRIASGFEKINKNDFIPELEKILDAKTEINIPADKKRKDSIQGTASIYTIEDVKKISAGYTRGRGKTVKRSYCSGLEKMVGKNVLLMGWIHRKRDLGGIEFYELRDRTGFTQLVIEGEKPVERLSLESVVEVTGRVTKEERSPYNNIEIKVEKVNMLSNAETNLPVNINTSPDNLNLPTILDNRTISVRNPDILINFRVQSEIVKLFAEYLRMNDFTEIKTPKII